MNRNLTPVRCLDLYEGDYELCIESCRSNECDLKCQADLDEKVLKYGDATSTDPLGKLLNLMKSLRGTLTTPDNSKK